MQFIENKYIYKLFLIIEIIQSINRLTLNYYLSIHYIQLSFQH